MVKNIWLKVKVNDRDFTRDSTDLNLGFFIKLSASLLKLERWPCICGPYNFLKYTLGSPTLLTYFAYTIYQL